MTPETITIAGVELRARPGARFVYSSEDGLITAFPIRGAWSCRVQLQRHLAIAECAATVEDLDVLVRASLSEVASVATKFTTGSAEQIRAAAQREMVESLRQLVPGAAEADTAHGAMGEVLHLVVEQARRVERGRCHAAIENAYSSAKEKAANAGDDTSRVFNDGVAFGTALAQALIDGLGPRVPS